MSGDNFDQALFDILRTTQPGHTQSAAYAKRITDLRIQHGAETATWIVDGTEFAYDRFVQVSQHRLGLLVALDGIEQQLVEARKAYGELDRLIDRHFLPYLGHDAVVGHAFQTIALAVAGAKHHSPDPEIPEEV